ncbi:MAG: phosphate-starvation-inducible PsiE family protein [Candidatus Thiodiazotropha sp.]
MSVHLPAIGCDGGHLLKTRRLPVQFLIYIAITALTRMLTIDTKRMPGNTILATVTGAILMLTLAILILRYTSTKLKEDNE